MTTMTDELGLVTGGVDTHRDFHVAAVLDARGTELGCDTFAATATGYRQLHDWLGTFDEIETVGVEGTGAYGKGLARHLVAADVAVVEIDRPNRQNRRRRGKNDTIDAIAAARAAQSGDATAVAKTAEGPSESLRAIQVVARGVRAERIRAIGQLRALVVTAPELLDHYGVGPDSAATLLVTAGDYPEQLHTEAPFAKLCGTAPLDASTGTVTRRRLNRGGDRQANAALYRIALVRMRHDTATRDYVARRTHEGKSKLETIRCLK